MRAARKFELGDSWGRRHHTASISLQGAVVCNQDCDAAKLQSSDMVPVRPRAQPGHPQLAHPWASLMASFRSWNARRRRHEGGSFSAARHAHGRCCCVTLRWQRAQRGTHLLEFRANAGRGDTQLNEPRDVAVLGSNIKMIRVDRPVVVVAAVDTSLRRQLVDDAVQPQPGTPKVSRGPIALTPLAMPLDRLRTVLRIVPAASVPCRGS